MVAHSAVAEAAVVERRPTQDGRFGRYGGKYVPETLITALTELEQAYDQVMQDEAFKARLGTVAHILCQVSLATKAKSIVHCAGGAGTRTQGLCWQREPAVSC